ncbi:response regulator [Teredinibacter sp. KSP-S5-2]|uniref:response regulator n=1 Tax=Teredinibacter sp. KSP-S5-2 TaxID=3034506 RepID=UPI002934E671|nr:response regulator [Teredinibacter sp. KSP-S5-2]WNO09257.1 response regulator [Teredinibacter sp. KSP-S5-2]
MTNESTHILIVEDNKDNQELATWILEDEGYSVTCADSAEEGLELLELRKFDLILMDVSLPGMSGKDATVKIKSSPHLSDIPVIALTAHAVKGEKEEIEASGVDGLLTKPIDEELLIQTLETILPSK